MSLDLYIEGPPQPSVHTCRECGHQREVVAPAGVWETNITHNLSAMFREAGVYEILWHGDGLRAGDQIAALSAALKTMREDPDRFKKFSAPNGWGTYEQALPWLTNVLKACHQYPDWVFRCSG